jgi:hypothetical protein
MDHLISIIVLKITQSIKNHLKSNLKVTISHQFKSMMTSGNSFQIKINNLKNHLAFS